MIVGFTGTRVGMTDWQRQQAVDVLKGATEAHHGDCIGADAEFHELCQLLGVPVVLHPPSDHKARAFCGPTAVASLPPKPYLPRNRDIVDSCHLLIAAPKEDEEPGPARGQGTWSTVRYARQVNRQLRVLWPY